MRDALRPLGVFIAGMFMLLIAMIFMPSLDTSVATLAANTSGVASSFWGWPWLMTPGVVRLLYFVGGFLIVLFVAGLVWFQQKKNYY